MALPEYIKRMRKMIGSELLVLVGVVAIVTSEKGQVLLQLRGDVKKWGLPGGYVEPGEELALAVQREVKEETGLDVAPERIVGVYSGPDRISTYPNGDIVADTCIVFACREIGGVLRIDDDESLDLAWFDPTDLPSGVLNWIRQPIAHALESSTTYFFV